jgi:phosphate transport system substrate-binding protein
MSRANLPSLLVVALAVLLISGCGARGGADEQITVSGSTTILPIAEISAELFMEVEADLEYKVLVSGFGSSAGIESVSVGSSDIGTASRELKGGELDLGLVKTVIAYDAIAVIVHPDNPVHDLTSDQVKAIFQGRITEWSEVGGLDMPIGLVNRDEASGTREAFSKIVLDREPFDPTAAILPGTGQVRAVVASSIGAVGYISLGFVNYRVAVVAIDDVAPTRESVLDGSYPISRDLNFFTVGEPEGPAARYIDFVLSPEVQHGVLQDAGFVPVITEGD